MKATSLFIIVLAAVVSGIAEARDLTSRLGVGYRNAFVTSTLPSVGAIYYPSPDIGLVGALGVDTEDQNSMFGLSGGVRRIIFKEDNMNFFGAGQIAMFNQEVAGTKDSGFELAATFGGEFFLSGLESLGFNFESGMGITTVKKTRFRTLGESFLTAGIFFYF